MATNKFMRKISKEELKTIIENHIRWLKEDCDDWENMKADLSETDLHGTDLCGADLSGANLCRAVLRESDMSKSDMSGANLSGADLCRADLRGADMSGANLYGVSLSGTKLCGAENVPFIPMSCPDKGAFIGYKKAYGIDNDNEPCCDKPYIVEIEVLATSRRSSSTGRKCRCDKARVLSITNIDGSETEVKKVRSSHDSDFIYEVGEIVSEPNFYTDRFRECAAGIHFFINRQEAVDY